MASRTTKRHGVRKLHQATAAVLVRRITDRADAMGISQRAIADRLGLAHTTVAGWLGGRRSSVPAALLPALSEILEADVRYLLGMVDDPAGPAEERRELRRLAGPLRSMGAKLADLAERLERL